MDLRSFRLLGLCVCTPPVASMALSVVSLDGNGILRLVVTDCRLLRCHCACSRLPARLKGAWLILVLLVGQHSLPSVPLRVVQ